MFVPNYLRRSVNNLRIPNIPPNINILTVSSLPYILKNDENRLFKAKDNPKIPITAIGKMINCNKANINVEKSNLLFTNIIKKIIQ